jgi:hypothetical protein
MKTRIVSHNTIICVRTFKPNDLEIQRFVQADLLIVSWVRTMALKGKTHHSPLTL